MKSSNIISIGNISNLNRNTQEEINLSFLWKVDLIDIPRQAQISFFTPKARFNKQW
jgi:hypothetical protein